MSALDNAVTGMRAYEYRLQVIANNLANLGTAAFKQDIDSFFDLGYQQKRMGGSIISDSGDTFPSAIRFGMGVAIGAVNKNYTQGNLTAFDSEYAVAIDGLGFIPVTLPNGETGYTRDGHLGINAQRELTDINGFVLQPVITIPNDSMSLTITPNGIVQVQQPGQNELTQVGNIELSRFNVEQLTPIGNNLYLIPPDGEVVIQDTPGTNGLGLIKQYFIEESNVNPMEQLALMIRAQHAFEANVKSMQTSQQVFNSALDIRA